MQGVTNQKTGQADMRKVGYNPAETSPCNVMIPDTMFLWSTTGKNCTGEGADSIFAMASTAIASAVIVLGLLGYQLGALEMARQHI